MDDSSQQVIMLKDSLEQEREKNMQLRHEIDVLKHELEMERLANQTSSRQS